MNYLSSLANRIVHVVRYVLKTLLHSPAAEFTCKKTPRITTKHYSCSSFENLYYDDICQITMASVTIATVAHSCGEAQISAVCL